MAEVRLDAVGKRFGALAVVQDVDLTLADGEFVVLVGPSGCGKSTLMRMIAGLEEISSGALYIGGTRADALPPQRRNIAMVFQSYALYPHLSVFENIAFGPRLRGEKEGHFRPRITRAAEMLNLGPYLDRLPRALSGGQRQRVAMGRAVVREPALFLFDEPLSNLDAKLRVQMRAEIKALHQRLRNTVLYVTHDQIEAMTMADRIAVMNAGRIEQVGSPLALYDRPGNLFVAGFLGSPAMSFVSGTFVREGDGAALLGADGLRLALPVLDLPAGRRIVLGVRPEHVVLGEGPGAQAAEVELVEPTGAETHLYARLGEARICAASHQRLPFGPGSRVMVSLPAAHAHVFDAADGRRLN